MLAIIIYDLPFANIELVCGTRPSAEDTSILFCGAAAFTRVYNWDAFTHDLIAGDHVSDGVYYKGYECIEQGNIPGNTGSFVWYDGQWLILEGDAIEQKKQAAKHGGMAFSEEMIIHQGKYHYNQMTEKYRHIAGFYRVLAQVKDKLLVIESETLSFGDFVTQLEAFGVDEALFLDMGSVRYSFVRQDGVLTELGEDKKDFLYASNWIVFRK